MQSNQTLLLLDVLFAPDIHQNLASVLVLIKYDFELRFYWQGVNLSLAQQFYGFGYFLDDFIVLSIEQGSTNECFSYITSVVNYKNDVQVWYAKLGVI